ncbi:hypothetical protein ENBRE01_2267 [Enteropsectra breve]|nr:hypothetical protein ENBRE01_2267 [Enteropsectra breve]
MYESIKDMKVENHKQDKSTKISMQRAIEDKNNMTTREVKAPELQQDLYDHDCRAMKARLLYRFIIREYKFERREEAAFRVLENKSARLYNEARLYRDLIGKIKKPYQEMKVKLEGSNHHIEILSALRCELMNIYNNGNDIENNFDKILKQYKKVTNDLLNIIDEFTKCREDTNEGIDVLDKEINNKLCQA